VRPRTRIALIAGLAVTGASLGGGAATGAVSHRPARLLVYAQEWSLWASRPALPHGAVIVQLWNRGEDAHNLHVRRLGRHGVMVGGAQALPLTESGALGHGRWHLARGRYELYCSLPGHLALGMHTVLVVH
jgi:hypothetical protein